jgi:hypothetical protein
MFSIECRFRDTGEFVIHVEFVAVIIKPNGECAYRLLRQLRHDRDDSGGIHPAAEECAKRYVAHQP